MATATVSRSRNARTNRIADRLPQPVVARPGQAKRKESPQAAPQAAPHPQPHDRTDEPLFAVVVGGDCEPMTVAILPRLLAERHARSITRGGEGEFIAEVRPIAWQVL